MAERDSSLNDFLSSLSKVKPDNIQAKELELARTKNKHRKVQAKKRKQKQRMREMAASLQATQEEDDRLQSEILRIQAEMVRLTDDMDTSSR